MISPWEKLSKKVSKAGQDENFLGVAHWVENIAAKVLAVALSLVILISLTDLVILLVRDLMADPVGFLIKR